MAQRSSSEEAPVEGSPPTVEFVRDGIVAVAACRTIQTAVLAALDAVVSAGDAIVGRGLLNRASGATELGPVGGSIHQRLLIDHFLAHGNGGTPPRPVVAGVHHVERVPVVLDGVDVAELEFFFFESFAADDLGPVIGALAEAVGLVARAERDDQRVRDQLRMIGNLSHELRSPLTTVIGYTDILTRSWREIDDAERDRVLAVLDRQARRMVRLSLEAATIAKTGDVGMCDLRLDCVDLAAAVQIAVTDLVRDHDVAVRCVEGLTVMADPDRLQQMLLNLLGNALAHGEAPIEVEAVRGPTGDFVHVVVIDHGPGIDPALLPHVFEPFTRGRSDPSDDHAGLGLSIVRQLAQRHGGDLFYEPNRPAGARMTLSLPAPNA